ncbi:MAG: YrdB family protein [Actinomycetota bacterium]
MRGVLLLVRFLCELAMLAAFGYWGFRTGDGAAGRALLGIGAPLVVAIVWGVLLSPKRRYDLPVVARIVIELALFGAAAVALAAAAQPALAVTLAAVAVVQRVGLSALGEH